MLYLIIGGVVVVVVFFILNYIGTNSIKICIRSLNAQQNAFSRLNESELMNLFSNPSSAAMQDRLIQGVDNNHLRAAVYLLSLKDPLYINGALSIAAIAIESVYKSGPLTARDEITLHNITVKFEEIMSEIPTAVAGI